MTKVEVHRKASLAELSTRVLRPTVHELEV